MKKGLKRFLLAVLFAALTGLLILWARTAPEAFFSVYPTLSRSLLRLLSWLTGWFPFALWEILVLVLAFWLIFSLVRTVKKREPFLKWVAGVLLTASVGVFLFVGIWGLNHYGPTVDEALELPVRKYTVEELTEATKYYAAEASRLAGLVPREENGEVDFADFSALAQQAGEGYDVLESQYELFSGSHRRVKKLASWRMFSEFGTTGIFICLTGESCVNPDTYEVWIPFTMCHEIGHRQAVAAEDGANFCAYLACMASERVEFRYSGAFAAYVYCNNALYSADRDAASDIWWSLDERVRADSDAATAHYAQYEGQVQEAAQKVNDTYLKAFSEESGVKSYGEVADDLVAWYFTKIAGSSENNK